MKTPREIVDGQLGKTIPVTRDGLEKWVNEIQNDASTNLLPGLREAWRLLNVDPVLDFAPGRILDRIKELGG